MSHVDLSLLETRDIDKFEFKEDNSVTAAVGRYSLLDAESNTPLFLLTGTVTQIQLN